MTAQILVQCPTCFAKMKLASPQVPSMVACPSCAQQIKLTPQTPTADATAPMSGPTSTSSQVPAAGLDAGGIEGPSFDNLPPATDPLQPAVPRPATPQAAPKKGTRPEAPARSETAGAVAAGTEPYRSTSARPKPKRKKPLNLKGPVIGLGILMAVVVWELEAISLGINCRRNR